MTRSIITF